MGLDLSLLPFYDNHLNFSHTVIDVPRDPDVFHKIRFAPQVPVDDGFTSYVSRDDKCSETHYGETTMTPYGERLTWCRARDLKRCGFDGPVGAYVVALADEHKVALYWR